MHDANEMMGPVTGLPADLPVIEFTDMFAGDPDGLYRKTRRVLERAAGPSSESTTWSPTSTSTMSHGTTTHPPCSCGSTPAEGSASGSSRNGSGGLVASLIS
jgi:hypothetical protein